MSALLTAMAALLTARCYLTATVWLCATVTVSAELCKDHMLGCSFYTQDCEFMGRLCLKTCGYCLANSERHNPSSLNVDDSERDEIPGTDPGSQPEGRHIGRTARALPGTDAGSQPEGSHIGRTARALPGSGWNLSIPRSLSVGNPARPLPSLGGDSSTAKEVQSVVADAFSHLENVSEDDSFRDGPESYDASLPTEQYRPLSYMDVISNNNRFGSEFSTGQFDEAGYNFVYEEGEGSFGTSKNDSVDLRLLDIDYLRRTGLLGEEIQGKHKKSQMSLTTEEIEIVELFIDQYNNLEESARVFNGSDQLEESTDKFIRFYEAGSSLAFTEFLYRLFTNSPSTGSYDDYFSESEEQVANFIDAIVTFDVNNLKRSV